MAIVRFIDRKDTRENWELANPVLALGERGLIINSDSGEYKVGDGSTPWNALPSQYGIQQIGRRGEGVESVNLNGYDTNQTSGRNSITAGMSNKNKGNYNAMFGAGNDIDNNFSFIAGMSNISGSKKFSTVGIIGRENIIFPKDNEEEATTHNAIMLGYKCILKGGGSLLFGGTQAVAYRLTGKAGDTEYLYDIEGYTGLSLEKIKSSLMGMMTFSKFVSGPSTTKEDLLNAICTVIDVKEDSEGIKVVFDKTIDSEKDINNEQKPFYGCVDKDASGCVKLGCSAMVRGRNNVAGPTAIISGKDAVGFGYKSVTEGQAGSAFGLYNISRNFGQMVLGVNNTADTVSSPTDYNAEAEVFTIGNGSRTVEGNAFKVKMNGTVYADNTTIQPNADYAEMFEWQDGNPSNEDRVGYFVSIEGQKIVKAKSSSKAIGIISACPAVIGDAPMRWMQKYLNDEWGRPIYEDIEVEKVETISCGVDEYGNEMIKTEKSKGIEHRRKLNPDYNPKQAYIPREERPEWDAVGLLGKLLVRQDGSLKVGDYCKSNDQGIATKSIDGYYVMEVINENIVKILFK